ncbi:MAG: cyclic nucleotide-binding domain-containing protein [Anaerolineae bacterium]|nr:cyclic nucleotide-binding domain-containing protein [Anaerolineae bacterium]
MLPDQLTPQELKRLLAAELDTVASTAPVDELHLLRMMPDAARKALMGAMTEQTYARGDVIFHEGAPGDIAYLIWSGKALVIKGDLDSSTILGYRGPGDILGEMALLENQPRSASVIALTDLRLLQIRKEDFTRLLSDIPTLSVEIMATMSARLRVADTIRDATTQAGHRLEKQVSSLMTREKELLDLQQMRQETVDLIVHDLRNPLNIIINVLELLDVTLPQEVREDNQQLLEAGRSANNRMRRLVDTLLDTSRLESGEARLDPKETDIAQLIQTAITALALSSIQKDIHFHTRIQDNLPTVMLDTERIERVVCNLLDNAVKYTLRGTISIAAKLAGNCIEVSVNDAGPGIPPAEREHIFARFTQVESEERRRRGFGLGLRFCYLAVQAHGGNIWVESGDDGIGSKFVFTLPVRET